MFVYPHIDPIALKIGPLAIHWYGLMYLIGFTLSWWLARYRATPPKNEIWGGWTRQQVGDYIFYGALGAIVGGRIGYMLIYGWDTLSHNPLSLFYIWQGGMSFHGGLVGVMLANWFFARSTGRSWLQTTDFIAPYVPIGLGCGRIGNFINGELWGRPTDMPWGMVFPYVDNLPRHPSQLYEVLLEGVLLFIILMWFSHKRRPIGAVSALFVLLYGAFRFFVEFFRQPDAQMGNHGIILFQWMTTGQLLCIPMMLVGIAVLVWTYSRQRKTAA